MMTLEEAIANATPYNPTGDLISREDLKEAVKNRFDNSAYFPFRFLALIDNAPTVDIKDQIAGAYNEGYMCGSKEAEKARSQGEWVEKTLQI